MAESENTETGFDDKVSDSETDLDVSTVSTHSTDLQDPETESASILLPENYALIEQQNLGQVVLLALSQQTLQILHRGF